MWLVFIPAWVQDLHLGHYGLYPRKVYGLLGIFTAPLLHGDWLHLLSNTFPLILLSAILFYSFPTGSGKIMAWLYVVTGFLSWLMARPAYHIGASGIVYALAGFLFFSGMFRKDRSAASISVAIAFLYGGMIYGIFPGEERISWESHLAGGVAGMVMAFIFRKTDLPAPEITIQEPEEPEPLANPPQLNVSFTGQPEVLIRYTYVPRNPEPPAEPEEEEQQQF